uniref:SspB-related isopeptide-forming adhesin n=1 Tax=Streptococcus pluranimalium TaxID=82348 RepID=UPI003F694C67
MTKTKKKIIAGATLGVFAGVGFVGANASADEVTATTDNTATNLVTTQPVATPENTNAAANAGTETGEIVTPVKSTGLNEAVNAAENAGVVVEETPIETVETIEEADTSLQKQEDKVEEATETAKEISKITTESENKANSAGVELKEESKVTYKDDTKKAIIDASEQAAKLETATNVQNEINSNLPKAQDKAREAGVTVSVADQVKYEDAQKALADLNAQVAKLEATATVQSDIDSALALAVASARKSGLNVELSENATFKDVQTALKAKDVELQKLVDAEQAQINANKTISDAAANAQAQGTVVKNTGIETVSADQAEARAQEIAKRIAEIVTTNKGISEENARKQAEYEAEVERIKEENRRIDLRNVEIRLENSRKKADYEKALADLKADQENVANQNTVIRAENERRQAEYEAALKALEAEQNDVAAKNEAIRAENARKQTEYEKALAELKSENSDIEAQNESIRAENTRKKAEYEKALAEANTNNEATAERNREIEAENARKKAEYEKALAEAQANTTKDGYLSKAIAQNLVFQKDTGAYVSSITGAYKFISPDKVIETGYAVWTWDPAYWLKDNSNFTDTLSLKSETNTGKGQIDNASYWIIAEANKPVTITYDGLTNSSYKGKPITKAVYTLTPTKTQGNSKYVVYQIMKDPTQGFKYGSLSGERLSAILRGEDLNSPDELSTVNKLSISYFYGNGEKVDFSDGTAILVSGSRNGGIDQNGTPQGEYLRVLSDNITPVTITGSSIGVYNGNVLTSTVSQKKEEGATYSPAEWDNADSSVRWYGAGAVAVNSGSEINIEFGTLSYGGIQEWFTFNTEAIYKNDTPVTPSLERTRPIPPVNVTPPTYEEELTPVEREITPPTPTPELPPVEREITPPTPTPELPPVEREITPPTYENELPPVEDNTTPPTPEELLESEMKNLVVATNVTPVTIETDTHKITMVVPVHDVEVATTVNPVQVKQTPSNSKAVNNAEGVNVDKQLVAKSSTIKWVLSNEALKGGRDYTVSYVLTDPLPKGFELNLLATAEATPDYNVKYDGATHTLTFIAKDATLFNLNADVANAAVVPVATIVGTVLNDGATYQNTFTTTVTSAETVIVDKNGKTVPNGKTTTYKVTSNTPEVYTPDNLIEPSKHIYTKDGQQVDGKTLLPNTEVAYTAVFDLDQFKGMTATAEDIAKGIAFFDDLQDNTVSINVDGIVNKLADGTVVTELVATQYNSVSEAPEALQAIIEKSGISLDGQFIAWVPVNPTEFYNKYIVTGQSIYHTMPITVGDYVGTFQNKVWQVVFGNGYEGNIVENNIPKLEVLKDAVKSVGSNKSIADGTVELGQTFPYVLDGPAIQANIVGGLQSYVFTDDFDEEHDEYNGEFYAFADQDIKLKDGTVIKAGDEITRYFVQNIIRNEKGVAESVTLSVDPTFLASIAEDGVFDPKVYLLVTRIAYAENVENTVKVSVNGYEVTSNTVVTHTPEPKEPETPETPKDPEKPVTTTPVKPTTPVAPASVLPSTGDNVGNLASVLGMALLSILGLFGLKKRKED